MSYVCSVVPGARCLFLALKRDNARRIAWDILSSLDAQYGLDANPNRTRLEFEYPGGGMIAIAGADYPQEFLDRYLGSQWDIVIIDEAGSFAPRTLDHLISVVIEPACMDRDGLMLMTGTPREIHDGPFFAATGGQIESDSDYLAYKRWTSSAWNTGDNPHICDKWAAKIRELKQANPGIESEPAFIREYLGKWSRCDGDLVYGVYAHNIGICEHEQGDRSIIGVDIGHDDPCAFVVGVYDPKKDRRLRIPYAYRQSGMLFDDIAMKLKELLLIYPGATIHMDYAWKTITQDLRLRHGLPIIDAVKHGKHEAIRTLNTDFVNGDILLDKTGANVLLEELRRLPKKYKDGGDWMEHPGFDNHCTDALLYLHRVAYHWIHSKDSKPEHGSNAWALEMIRKNQRELANRSKWS
jgi:hypothetical protein